MELVVVTPFLLMLMAAIWDVRAYTAYRTDSAREMYAVAELLAASGDDTWTAMEKTDAATNIINAATARLDDSSVGWLRAVVVTRQQATSTPVLNSEGRDCDDTPADVDDPDTPVDETTVPWCEPVVRREIAWATWGDQGGCATIDSSLPATGAVFAQDELVLPHEDADPDGDGPLTAPTHDQWVSRSLAGDEWWVVVETCSHFGRDADPNDAVSSPGLLLPGIEDISATFFDARLTIYNRVAWAAFDELDECHWEWCTAP